MSSNTINWLPGSANISVRKATGKYLLRLTLSNAQWVASSAVVRIEKRNGTLLQSVSGVIVGNVIDFLFLESHLQSLGDHRYSVKISTTAGDSYDVISGRFAIFENETNCDASDSTSQFNINFGSTNITVDFAGSATLLSLPVGQIAYGSGTGIASENKLFWDALNNRLAVNGNAPTARISIYEDENRPEQFISLFNISPACGCVTTSGGLVYDDGNVISDNGTGLAGSVIINFPQVLSPGNQTYISFYYEGGPLVTKINGVVVSNTPDGTTRIPITQEAFTFEAISAGGYVYLEIYSIEYLSPAISTGTVLNVIDPFNGTAKDWFGLVVANNNVSFSDTLKTSTGQYNFAALINALASLTSGNGNIAVGQNAARYLTSDFDNIVLGQLAMEGQAVQVFTNSRNFVAGVGAMRYTRGGSNIVIGEFALQGFLGGTQAFASNNNIVFGRSAGQNAVATSNNILIGDNTGRVLNLGFTNVIIGGSAGAALVGGFRNIFLGGQAGGAVVGGARNIYIGSNSSRNNLNGVDNISIGADSGLNSTASSCIYIGPLVGGSNTVSGVLMIDNTNTLTPIIAAHFANRRMAVNLAPSDATNTLDVGGTLRVRTTNSVPSTSIAGLDANGVITNSHSLGVQFPTFTTTQRNAIPSPTLGRVIFNTTTDQLEVFKSTGWQPT